MHLAGYKDSLFNVRISTLGTEQPQKQESPRQLERSTLLACAVTASTEDMKDEERVNLSIPLPLSAIRRPLYSALLPTRAPRCLGTVRVE